jgi:hypothetical protein
LVKAKTCQPNTKPRTSTDNVIRKYGYQYDDLNRLINSFYQKPALSNPITNMYNEQMDYDKNGNIKSLKRNGDFDSNIYGFMEIDDLVYDYDDNLKNQLVNVTDNTNDPKGFKDDAGCSDYCVYLSRECRSTFEGSTFNGIYCGDWSKRCESTGLYTSI